MHIAKRYGHNCCRYPPACHMNSICVRTGSSTSVLPLIFYMYIPGSFFELLHHHFMTERIMEENRSASQNDFSVFDGSCSLIIAGICNIKHNRQGRSDSGCTPGSSVLCQFFPYSSCRINSTCAPSFLGLFRSLQDNISSQTVIKASCTESVI